jgi:uncharacterized protein YecT (DUF1311 family)
MKTTLVAAAIAITASLPLVVSAQPLSSIEDFDADVHLNLSGCFDGSVGENLACFNTVLERCEGFTQDLGTAGGQYYCSQVAFEMVDRELNRVYPAYLKAAEHNAYGAERQAQSEEQLRAAQRAWVSYRDAMCEVQASWAAIGPGRDAVVDDCRARLTIMQLETLSTELGWFLSQ